MVKLTKIYTRTGDTGQTGLSDGSRTPKTCIRVGAFGAVDELNSALGLAVLAIKDLQLEAVITRIQNELFDLGADLSNPCLQSEKPALRISANQIKALETAIDEINAELPSLKSFVLPAGSEAGARLHLARAICRRAEREALLLADDEPVNRQALIYLNRLSDFLFVAARWVNKGGKEVLWVPGQSR